MVSACVFCFWRCLLHSSSLLSYLCRCRWRSFAAPCRLSLGFVGFTCLLVSLGVLGRPPCRFLLPCLHGCSCSRLKRMSVFCRARSRTPVLSFLITYVSL